MLPYLWVDSPVGYVLNGFMKFPAPLCAALLPVLFSCAEQVSRIEHVREVPLKTRWSCGRRRHAPHSGHLSAAWRRLPATAPSASGSILLRHMERCQSGTGGNPGHDVPPGKDRFNRPDKIHFLSAGRKGGTQNSVFEFIGDEAREKGEILAWKLVLKDNRGKTISERHSYLWGDDH